MRIAVVQLAYGDDEPFDARVDRVAGIVAGLSGHDLVVLPELWAPTGFGYQGWADEAQPLDGPWSRAMADAARSAAVVLHAGSFVEELDAPGPDGHDLANTSLVLDATGATLAVYRKVHRFGFGARGLGFDVRLGEVRDLHGHERRHALGAGAGAHHRRERKGHLVGGHRLPERELARSGDQLRGHPDAQLRGDGHDDELDRHGLRRDVHLDGLHPEPAVGARPGPHLSPR